MKILTDWDAEYGSALYKSFVRTRMNESNKTNNEQKKSWGKIFGTWWFFSNFAYAISKPTHRFFDQKLSSRTLILFIKWLIIITMTNSSQKVPFVCLLLLGCILMPGKGRRVFLKIISKTKCAEWLQTLDHKKKTAKSWIQQRTYRNQIKIWRIVLEFFDYRM